MRQRCGCALSIEAGCLRGHRQYAAHAIAMTRFAAAQQRIENSKRHGVPPMPSRFASLIDSPEICHPGECQFCVSLLVTSLRELLRIKKGSRSVRPPAGQIDRE